MGKVSIIVPIYNVEKYLSKCIESILSQTYKNIEIILVNDGSLDNSAQICDEYAKKDDRIIVIHKANGGVSSARNAGIDIATGKYIGFVDPDDYIENNMYELMVNKIEKYKADIAICGYDYINENYTIERYYHIQQDEILTQKQFMSMQFDMPPTIRHVVWNKLFIAKTLKKIRFPEGINSSEDVYVLAEYAKFIKKAVFIHKPLYKNLVRSGSATHGGLKIEDLAASFPIHEKMHREAVSLYPDLKMHSIAFLMDVFTLKYNEAEQKHIILDSEKKEKSSKYLKYMKKFIKKYSIAALFSKEIYWKTKIIYLMI